MSIKHHKITILLADPPDHYYVTYKTNTGYFDNISASKGFYLILSRLDIDCIKRWQNQNAQFERDNKILSDDEINEFLFFVEMQFEDRE